MATAEEYRRFARECLGWADRAQTVEHREILLDMATCWAEAAARLQQHGLCDQLVREAKGRLSGSRRASAIDGNGRSKRTDGRTKPNNADGVGLAKHERRLPREGGGTSSE
jgi:hypothetical protein